MTSRRALSPFVLLVGGDDSTAKLCARAASPLPVLRARHLGTAADRLRSLRPVALVVAADVASRAASELEATARAGHATVVCLDAADVDDVDELRRRMAG